MQDPPTFGKHYRLSVGWFSYGAVYLYVSKIAIPWSSSNFVKMVWAFDFFFSFIVFLIR